MCDKNLGPAICERTSYIQNVLKEHLLDVSTYQQLEENDADTKLDNMKTETSTLFVLHAHTLDKHDVTYF